MSNLRHTLHTLFKQTVETVTPPLTKSQFEEKRVRASKSHANPRPSRASASRAHDVLACRSRYSHQMSSWQRAITSSTRVRRGPGERRDAGPHEPARTRPPLVKA